MSARSSWPHFRTDLLGLASLGVVADCVVAVRWPLVVVFALSVALFCAVSPRMKGRFGFTIGTTGLGGTFADELKTGLKERPTEPDRPSGTGAPPSNTAPGEG
jgi:hypothetical protein